MTDFCFEAVIRCEGRIEDWHWPREKLQKWIENLIDSQLRSANHQADNLKLNIFRDDRVTIYRHPEIE